MLIEVRTNPTTGERSVACPVWQRERLLPCDGCQHYRGTENVNGVELFWPDADGEWVTQHFSRPSVRCAYVEHPVEAIPGQKPLFGGVAHV